SLEEATGFDIRQLPIDRNRNGREFAHQRRRCSTSRSNDCFESCSVGKVEKSLRQLIVSFNDEDRLVGRQYPKPIVRNRRIGECRTGEVASGRFVHRPILRSCSWRRFFFNRRTGARQKQRKRAPLALDAIESDLAAEKPGKLTTDCQSQTRSAVTAAR